MAPMAPISLSLADRDLQVFSGALALILNGLVQFVLVICGSLDKSVRLLWKKNPNPSSSTGLTLEVVDFLWTESLRSIKEEHWFS